MRARRLVVLAIAAAGLVAGCAGDNVKPGVNVVYAIVQLVDSTGAVTSQVNVPGEGAVGPSIVLPRGKSTKLRMLWMSADSAPEPAAADPVLGMRVQVPTGFGMTWTPSPASRFEGTMATTTAQPGPVFIPIQLVDNTRGVTVFGMLAPFSVP